MVMFENICLKIQNLTELASNQAPDKLKCAQTLLDELLAQVYSLSQNCTILE